MRGGVRGYVRCAADRVQLTILREVAFKVCRVDNDMRQEARCTPVEQSTPNTLICLVSEDSQFDDGPIFMRRLPAPFGLPAVAHVYT